MSLGKEEENTRLSKIANVLQCDASPRKSWSTDRFHMTSSLSKIKKTKDPPKFLSLSGLRGGIFISV